MTAAFAGDVIEEHGGKSGHRYREDNTDAACQRLQDFSGDHFDAEHLFQVVIIGHEQQRDMQPAADIGQHQRIGHRSHDVPTNGKAASHQAECPDVRVLAVQFGQRRGNIHTDVHRRTDRADDDGGEDNPFKVDRVLFVDKKQHHGIVVHQTGHPHLIFTDQRNQTSDQYSACTADPGCEAFDSPAADQRQRHNNCKQADAN